MTSALKGIALFSGILLSPLANPAEAASCTSWPTVCTTGDGRFLTGTAEIEGWIDATAIGMSTRERYRLTFTSHGVSQGTIHSESAFASLDMDQSGNTVTSFNDDAIYDGGSTNSDTAPAPYSDRFGGGVSLVPSLSYPGRIINDYSLGAIDLDLRAEQGVLWPAKMDPNISTANAGSFSLSIGLFGLDIDPVDPDYYDVDQDNYVLLTASSFDLMRFTYSDEEGGTMTRELTMQTQPAAIPLPASAVLLLAALGGLALLRNRRGLRLHS